MDDNAATVPRDANAVMADAAAEPAVVKPGDGWVHVKKGLNEQQRECWTCNYCGKETLGRNATRVSAGLYKIPLRIQIPSIYFDFASLHLSLFPNSQVRQHLIGDRKVCDNTAYCKSPLLK